LAIIIRIYHDARSSEYQFGVLVEGQSLHLEVSVLSKVSPWEIWTLWCCCGNRG